METDQTHEESHFVSPPQVVVLDAFHPIETGLVVPVPHVERVEPHIHSKDWLKAVAAFVQMALAVVLFGMIAFQMHYWPDSSTRGSGVHYSWTAQVVLMFGLAFAVLQAIAGVGMYCQLVGSFQHGSGHDSVLSTLNVTLAIGFLAMGFACKNIEIGVPAGVDPGQARIMHAIEGYLIINWFVTLVCVILSSTKRLDWEATNIKHLKAHRKTAFAIAIFVSSLILLGLLAAVFQAQTGGVSNTALGLNGVGTLFMTFAVLFAVLQTMSGVTMLQQCSKFYQCPSAESVTGVLTITLAFGVIAFGIDCRHIYLGIPSSAEHNNTALIVALQSFIIINFILLVSASFATGWGFIHWDSEAPAMMVKGLFALGLIQLLLAIVLFALLGAEVQMYTHQQMEFPKDVNFAISVGLNPAGENMLGFGLVFAVLEGVAGLTMLAQASKKLPGQTLSSASVLNKITFAASCLALGFACRHIQLFRSDSLEPGYFVALVHSIEAMIIVNWAFTLFIEIITITRGM